MSISIKILDKNTLPAVLQVVTRSFSTVAEEFGLTRENCPEHTAFVQLDDLERDYENGYQMFGLYTAEQLASFASLSSLGDGVYQINRLSTLPPYRHRGYGRILLKHCEEAAAMLGAVSVEVTIIDENTRLKNWYLCQGFVPVRVEQIDGLPCTVGHLAKNLKDAR